MNRPAGAVQTEEEISRYEARIKLKFAAAIRRELQRTTAGLKLPAPIVVTVKDIRYGSMDIILDFGPVEQLGKFVDSNFDYFEVFLRGYSPPALSRCLPFPEEYIGQLSVRVDASTGFLSAFNKKPSTFAIGDATKRAQWLLVLSNTSLVVPTILGAFFLYLGWKTLDQRYATLDGISADLAKALAAERTTAKATGAPAPTASQPTKTLDCQFSLAASLVPSSRRGSQPCARRRP